MESTLTATPSRAMLRVLRPVTIKDIRMTDRMLHREASLRFLERNGRHPTLVEPKSKRARPASFGARTKEQSEQNIVAARQSEEVNVGLHCFGDIVDIDVDTKDGLLRKILQDRFSDNSFRFGRPSNPDSHFLFEVYWPGDDSRKEFDRSEYPILQDLKTRMGIEVLGGPASAKQHCLLPGSVYSNDNGFEHSQWHDLSAIENATPIRVAFHDLLSTLRQACAISLLVPFWSEGNRHTLMMALSGMLYRFYYLSQDPEVNENHQDNFALDRPKSWRFLCALMDYAGDDKKDRYMRKKTFESTWKKASQGVPVTGGKTLAAILGDGNVVRNLYVMLSNSLAMSTVEHALNRFVLYRDLVVDLEDVGRVGSVGELFMPEREFTKLYSGQHKFKAKKANGGFKTIYIPEVLHKFDAVQTAKARALILDPYAPVITENTRGQAAFNLWQGWETDPIEASEDDVSPFLQYVWEVLASEDEDKYHWILAWIANIFQTPTEKPGTALVLVGKPGTGKTTLFARILRPIIGMPHTHSTTDVNMLVGNKFNEQLMGKLLIALEEASSSRQRQVFHKLKDFITGDTMNVEAKYKPMMEAENHVRLLLTSNEVTDVIYNPDGGEDRRYTVIKVSDKYKQNRVYFGNLIGWLGQNQNLARVHGYLKEYRPPDGIDPAQILQSEEKRMVSRSSMKEIDDWLMQIVDNGYPLRQKRYWWQARTRATDTKEQIEAYDQTEWPRWVHYGSLVEDINELYGRRTVSESTLGVELKARGLRPDRDRIRTAYTYTLFDTDTNQTAKKRGYAQLNSFPSYEDVLNYLKNVHGYEPGEVIEVKGEERVDEEPTEF